MNIAVAVNKRFFRYLYVMLVSLLENNKSYHVRIYILHLELVKEQVEAIGNLIKQYGQEFCFIKVARESFPETLPVNETITIETYFRLALPELLPEELERILYLDVDVIINQSLQEMYEMDFEEKFFCVCRDVTVIPSQYSEQSGILGKIRSEQRYFNAGVLLFNLEKLRRKTSFGSFVKQAVRMKDELVFHDQDLLNCLFYNDVKYLDAEKFNLIARTAYNAGVDYSWVKEHTVIIHYVGPKPWDYKEVRYMLEAFWWEYAKMTSFYTELLEGVVLSEVQTGYMDMLFRQLKRENEEWRGITDKCMKLLGI